MLIQRPTYLNQLIRKQWNGRIKVLTGIRRCGKSTILLEIFYSHLIAQGVNRDNIITIILDDDLYAQFRDPAKLSEYVHNKCNNADQKYYLLLDEVQYAISRKELHNPDDPVRLYSVLNGFLHKKNIDVYVTGSNSKLLSKDISTEFRGRSDSIHIYPLSFQEFYAASNLDKLDAYNEYTMYGGMPYLLNLDSDEDKFNYLNDLFEEIYFKDIEERYTIRLPGVLREMTSSLCSSVGSLTNASKIARMVSNKKGTHADSETISTYLSYLTDSFLFSKAEQYDIKGKHYYEYPSKYYCSDVGLRNARLRMRQQEPTHLMENILYNELLVRHYSVDVGVVQIREHPDRTLKRLEIDFIARKGSKQYYIQSAFRMEDPEKEKIELRPLLSLDDSFKKIVVSQSYNKPWTDEHGILRIGLIEFLLDENSMDR